MPLTAKGEKIKAAMQSEYGKEKGERVFFASKNAGKISGVDDAETLTLEQGRQRQEYYTKALKEGRITKEEYQGFMEAIGGLVAGIKRKQVADAVGKLAARFDSFLVRRRSGFKTRHDAEKDYGVRAAVTRAMVKVGDRVRHVDYGPATVTKVEKNGAIHIKTEAGDTGTTTVGSLRKL